MNNFLTKTMFNSAGGYLKQSDYTGGICCVLFRLDPQQTNHVKSKQLVLNRRQ